MHSKNLESIVYVRIEMISLAYVFFFIFFNIVCTPINSTFKLINNNLYINSNFIIIIFIIFSFQRTNTGTDP